MQYYDYLWQMRRMTENRKKAQCVEVTFTYQPFTSPEVKKLASKLKRNIKEYIPNQGGN